jgi:hypothetical protein
MVLVDSRYSTLVVLHHLNFESWVGGGDESRNPPFLVLYPPTFHAHPPLRHLLRYRPVHLRCCPLAPMLSWCCAGVIVTATIFVIVLRADAVDVNMVALFPVSHRGSSLKLQVRSNSAHHVIICLKSLFD